MVLTSGADASLVDSLVAGTLQRLVVLTPKWSLAESSATTLQSTPRLETVTAVGVRLEADDSLTVIAPLGTDDLLGLCCRPTAFGRTQRSEYEARINSKRWRELWPKVKFLD